MPTRQELRDKVASADDIKRELVHHKAWDIDVEVRGMDGTARAAVMRVGYFEGNVVNYLTFYPALIISTCFVPGTDVALFDAADADLINSKSAAALEELAVPAMRLSGLSKEDLVSAEKNSVPTPSSASGST
jgi:hypothetical protein